MRGASSEPSRPALLAGRQTECGLLDQLLDSLRAGQGQALVVHGEPGIGKSALLDYLDDHATGCRVARTVGVESEMEMAFAGLHQVCAPMLDHVERLAVPQRDALRTALGVASGPAPDLFLVGLGVLSLLSEIAQEQPLLCLIDDHRWLDHASAHALAFAARRLSAEPVALIFAARELDGSLQGLPTLEVHGLRPGEARELLDAAMVGPLDTKVRDQLVAETGGNPLALLELPRGMTQAELAGGFGVPGAAPLVSSIEASFRRQFEALPDAARRLMLIAAADPTGDASLLWRAASQLGVPPDAAAAVRDAGLADFEARVRLRHPLLRSAVYHAATNEHRRVVHAALADATDRELDPDRRAWHLAAAAVGPDEDIARELELSAGRARARGGLAAAAAFLERAAVLTLDPEARVRRALSGAQAKLQAGDFDGALDLLSMAEEGGIDQYEQAQVDLTHAQLAYLANRGSDAARLLLNAAERLRTIDPNLSRASYLDALAAAVFAGRLAKPGADVTHVARAASAAPAAHGPGRAPDLLLDGLVADYCVGYASERPKLQRALDSYGAGLSSEEELHWMSWATVTAIRLWRDDHWDSLSARHVRLAREAGALSELPLALTLRTYMLLFAGDLTAAASLAGETQAVKDATGSSLAPYGALALAAFRGHEKDTLTLLESTAEDVDRRGEGLGITLAEWAHCVLYIGLAQYDKALVSAERATVYEPDLVSMVWPTVEIVEAAVRAGCSELGARRFQRLSEMTVAAGTDWALGLRARTLALLSEDDVAEDAYREALERLGRTHMRTDLARAHLLYGEWLRRARRRIEAREQLRTAHRMFEAMGLGAFAERTGRELQATGETARKRSVAQAPVELTAQETQIARMARDGLSNPEIGGRLFISAHTVQYHLRKVYAKLGITSRAQLGDRLLA